MKRATLIALMAFLSVPAVAFADPGHSATYEAYEWLHYLTSFRHVAATIGGIAFAIAAYKLVRRFTASANESIKN